MQGDRPGLTYFGRRFYDSMSGVWMSEDPAILEDGDSYLNADARNANAYLFNYNNPLRFLDPDGKEGFDYWDDLEEIPAQKITDFVDVNLELEFTIGSLALELSKTDIDVGFTSLPDLGGGLSIEILPQNQTQDIEASFGLRHLGVSGILTKEGAVGFGFNLGYSLNPIPMNVSKSWNINFEKVDIRNEGIYSK